MSVVGYTDVNHMVTPVEEGFRVVLNYSLSFEGAMCPSDTLHRMSQSAVHIVKDYFITFDNEMLAILLTYEYTQATQLPEFLKGIDAHVFNALEELAAPELRYVLLFDKTKVTLGIEEHNDEQIFQDVFLV